MTNSKDLVAKLRVEYVDFIYRLSNSEILRHIGKIAAMRDIYKHIVINGVPNEYACAYLLALESPLEVLTDYWLECDKCIGDSIDHTIWAVCDRNIADGSESPISNQNTNRGSSYEK